MTETLEFPDLRAARLARGWTQVQLAAAAGVPQPIVSQFELRAAPPARRSRTYDAIVQTLGLAPEDPVK
jgi:transcriptional regulator with XRE-family HTH domain